MLPGSCRPRGCGSYRRGPLQIRCNLRLAERSRRTVARPARTCASVVLVGDDVFDVAGLLPDRRSRQLQPGGPDADLRARRRPLPSADGPSVDTAKPASGILRWRREPGLFISRRVRWSVRQSDKLQAVQPFSENRWQFSITLFLRIVRASRISPTKITSGDACPRRRPAQSQKGIV